MFDMMHPIDDGIVCVLLLYIASHIHPLRFHSTVINIGLCLSILFVVYNLSLPENWQLLILILAFLFFIFKDTLIKQFYTFFMLYMIIIFSKLLTFYLFNGFLLVANHENVDVFSHLPAMVCYHIFNFVMGHIYMMECKNSDMEQLPSFSWFVFILPLTTVLLISNINYYQLMTENVFICIAVVGLLLSNFITLYIFLLVIKYFSTKDQIKTFQLQNEFVSQHLSAHFDYMHKLLNELHHISKTLPAQAKTTKIQLNKLIGETYDQFNIMYTNSIALNAVINSKIDDLSRYHIQFSHQIMYLDFSYLDYEHQVQLFTCLLDQAINANKKDTKNKLILLKSKKHANQLLITEKYTYQEKLSDSAMDQFEQSLHKIIPNSHKVLITHNTDDITITLMIFHKNSNFSK